MILMMMMILINFYIVRYIDSDAAVSPFTGHQSIEDNIKRWEDEGNLGIRLIYILLLLLLLLLYLLLLLLILSLSLLSVTQIILFVVINTFPNQVIIIYHINCHRHHMNSLLITPIYILSSHFLS